MNILLINPPIRIERPPQCFPLGLGYIASVLDEQDYNVEVLDINATRPSKEEVLSELDKRSYNIVCIGGLITTYTYVEWLIQNIRILKPDTTIIVGGGLGSSIPDIVLKNLNADIVVIGEGEITIKELTSAIANNEPTKEIKGIAFKEENNVVIKTPKREPILDLDSIPFPKWELFPIEIYIQARGSPASFGRRKMDIISSRGCPYDCIYCYHLFGRSNYRFRSAKNMIDEINEFVDCYKIKYIEFLDDNFLINRKRAFEFCDMFEENFGIEWSTVGRVNNVDEELLKRVKKAGCNYIVYGLESGSQKILDSMNKKTKVEQNKRAVEMAERVGLYQGNSFMIGMVGESEETFNETLQFCKKMRIHNTPHITQAYPGTPLYEIAKQMGRIKDEEAYLRSLGDSSYLTANLTDIPDERLLDMVQIMSEETKLPKLHELYRHWRLGGIRAVRHNTVNYLKRNLKIG